MKRILMIFVFAVLLILALARPEISCRSTPTGEGPQTGLPSVTMQLGGRKFTLEVAATRQSRQTGLMYRDSMASYHGMIFVFPAQAPEPVGFWMKNTRIPLDIVYIGEDQRIVSIHQMKPYDTRPVPADGPYKWAIELNENTAAKLGLLPGQQLEIPLAALSAAE